MRTSLLIFDDQTFEPITLVRVPWSRAELYERRFIRLAVPESLRATITTTSEEWSQMCMKIVNIEIELFVRNRHNVEQRSIIGFTRQEELAAFLVPDWLPGQRDAIDAILDQQEQLERLLLKCIS